MEREIPRTDPVARKRYETPAEGSRGQFRTEETSSAYALEAAMSAGATAEMRATRADGGQVVSLLSSRESAEKAH